MLVPATLPAPLARVHALVRAQPVLARFTLANRLLLAMAFLPTGLVKVLGRRFTLLPLEHPVGFFFEAMYRTGPFWHFVGGVQVLAALLLVFPSTALLGALLFFPVGLSILLITWGGGFAGTVWVAAGMVLSVAWLICWDGDRVWEAGVRLAGSRPPAALLSGAPLLERVGWAVGFLAGISFFLMTRGFLPASWMFHWVGLGLAGGVMVLAGWVVAFRRVEAEGGPPPPDADAEVHPPPGPLLATRRPPGPDRA